METRSRSPWLALIALALSVLVVGLDATVLNVALPTLAVDLGATTTELQWIVNAYILALAGAMLPAGVLADRIGRKRVLLIGLGALLAGSVGAAFTEHIGTLIAMRVVMGVGAAITMPVVMALIPLMFDDAERPKAVGLMTAAVSVGVPLGPIVGGYLLQHYTWSSIFWINVPPVLLAIGAVLALIPESRAETSRPLDHIGAVLSVLGISALVYGFVEAPQAGWLSLSTLGWTGLGAVALVAFVVRQARTAHPLIDLGIFRNRSFSGGTLAMALLQFVMYGLLFTLPQYLQAVRGYDALGTGVQLIPMMAGVVVAAGASKHLLEHIGASRGTVIGSLVMAASLFALARLTVDTDMVLIGIGLTVFGLGAGVAMTSSMDAVLSSLPSEESGAGSSVMNTVRQLSGALGVAILGSILFTTYRNGLSEMVLSQLPDPARHAARESVMGAAQVAAEAGPVGEAIGAMANTSYTHAMAILLVLSGLSGIAAAIAGWLMIPQHDTSAEPTPAEGGAASEPA